MPFESNTETGGISERLQTSSSKSSTFSVKGRGHPQNDATPNFFANSKRPILGLSNEVSFVAEILWKDG